MAAADLKEASKRTAVLLSNGCFCGDTFSLMICDLENKTTKNIYKIPA